MKHVGIVVDDLAAAMAFFVELGLKLQGQWLVEGGWEDRIGEERLLAGERRRTILSAHSHQQFERPGPNGTTLVNPGSVGSPLDGDTRVAWALYEMGRIAFRQPSTTSSEPRRRCPP